jgi:DNA polymerase-3 subunit delta'
MLIGHEKLIKIYTRLVKERSLFHGYLFFGDAHIGKYTFAESLAYYIEHGSWERGNLYLNETKIMRPDEKGSIGINAVREIRKFLSEKPVHAAYRTVIVDDAHTLTPQAQHAFLKIAEEPPSYGLIILVVSNTEALLDTLQSRFQKIYFRRQKEDVIRTFLKEQYQYGDEVIDRIVSLSFGSLGVAKRMCENEQVKRHMEIAMEFVHKPGRRVAIMKDLATNKEDIEPLLQMIIMVLAANMDRNHRAVRIALERYMIMMSANTNKRLQMEAIAMNM